MTNALAAALRIIGAAQDRVDVVSRANQVEDTRFDDLSGENALWDLTKACDDAFRLLRPVLPPGVLPPETNAP